MKKEKRMIVKEGEVEKPIISGHLFLNKEDKKTAKSDLQKKKICS